MNKPLFSVCNKLYVSCGTFRQLCPISTTASCNLIQKYRKEKGLPLNPNSYGPLTDLPDYTFLDGRPTPLGMHQNKRMQKQQHIAKQIIQLSKEMDLAVQRHADKIRKEEDTKQRIIANKLKPKGYLLNKKQ